jgi:molybdopterin/thiamine biosynthesis adenylyltransferase
MSLSPGEVERYARHIVLRELGGPGQARLKESHALLVGAGGLGGPAALYLAASGVGRITLMDADTVSLSNLQRQILFATSDLDRGKAEAGAERLRAINPEIEVIADPRMLNETNAGEALAGVDVVLDGLDSYAARFALNAARHRAKIPMVSGAVERFSGQVSVFDSGRDADSPCYRCLVREAPPDAATCAQVGVVGAMAGVVGTFMALEAIKLLSGAGETLSGRLLMIDGLSGEARTARLRPDPDCPVCGGKT